MIDTLRILLPMDGSPAALRAVEYVIELARRGLPLGIHLLNVQAPVRGTAAALIAKSELDDYHRDEGMKVLAGARLRLEDAKLPVHLHVGVGHTGESVLAFARRLDCQQIVMGTRGLGGVAGMIMGSVASYVMAETAVPVTLIRAPREGAAEGE
jgi:nucleotide-binding universal stress UspA family protein